VTLLTTNSFPALAQEQPLTARDQQRLEQIEKQIQELIRAVKELQGGAPAANASARVDAPEPKAITLGTNWLRALTWRSIGPANMGGRSVDLAVVESDPCTYWVATASGGLLKTTNNGITFVHQFDRETTVSIGAVCVAPSDPNIVWVGTGENNPRNSVSYGDGVYKSTDGGKTWKNMGLKKSFQIGRVLIHPKDPNVVYVGALGRLYGSNEERGVFKTTNGGESWEKVLYVDDKTGVIDMRMHPTDPDTLIAATWERLRDGYDSHPGDPMPDGYDTYDPIKKWGPGSGLYKTTDGGKSWRKLTSGLPTCNMGRIGLDWYRKDPNIVFAIIDTEKIGMGTPPRTGIAVYAGIFGEDAESGVRLARVVENGPGAKAGLQPDDLIQTIEGKAITQAEQFNEEIRNHKVGDKLKLKVLRGDKTLEIVLTLERRPVTPGGAGGVYLGLAGEDAENGTKVTSVVPNGPSDRAGLRSDDVILAIADKALQSYSELLDDIRARNAGDKVKIKILRDDQPQEIEVTLAERPAGGPGGGRGQRGGRGGAPASGAYLGVTGEDAANGVRLTSIVAEGPAAKAGLKSDDLVQSVNEKAIDKYGQLVAEIRAHRAGDKLKLQVLRDQERHQIEVPLAERSQTGGPSQTRPSGASLGGQMENVQDEQGPNSFDYGGVYKSTNGGETWTRINSVNPRPMYFSKIRVDPGDDSYLYVLGVQLYRSTNGGKIFRPDGGRGIHADQHTLWINPRDGRHMIVGTDGGFYATYDRAANWDHLNHMALGQFYHVAICPKQPYHLAGGLQDNGSWCGPSAGLDGAGPINEDWMSIGGGDGFVCRVDPNDPDLIYAESQNGAIFRRNVRTGERVSIRPQRPDGAPAYRFNWNTPFILSSHNSRIFYSAGNYVFRSLDRGNNLQIISPEITLTKWGSATALAESPRNPNVLYAGTDDGALWITRDSGKTWTNIVRNIGLESLKPLTANGPLSRPADSLSPSEGDRDRERGTVAKVAGSSPRSAAEVEGPARGPRWVASIEPSRFVEGRAYVVFDGHRSDDDEPYVYVTEDFGKTWKSLRSNLPWGSTRVLREDLENPNLLFLGTEFGAWFSLDRGVYWNRLGANLPTVAVHEFALHPENGEIVAATHGRSLWVLDVSSLRQIKAEYLADQPALYQPGPAVRWRSEPARGRTNRRFVGQNPASGAQIYYSLPKKADRISLKIVDINGATLRELAPRKEPGLHRLVWDLRGAAPRSTNSLARGAASAVAPGIGPRSGRGGAGASEGGAIGRGGGSGGGGRGGAAPSVGPGTYRVVLAVDGTEIARTLRVESDPIVPDTVMTTEEIEALEAEEKSQRNQEREHRLYRGDWNPDASD